LGHGFWITLLLGSVCLAFAVNRDRSKQAIKALPLAFTLAVPLALSGWLYAFVAMPLQPPDEPIPSPNYYSELRKLADSWSNLKVPRKEFDSEQVRRQFASDHRAEIAELRRLAHASTWVVLEYKEDNLETLTVHLNPRQLAFGLENAALGQPAVTRAQIGLEMILLGDRLCHGGLFIDYLMATVHTERGVRLLHEAIAELSEAECQALLRQLPQLETTRESIDVVSRRDLIWCLYDGWEARAQYAGERLIGEDSIASVARSTSVQQQRRITWLRLLQLELALRMYQHQHERYPKALDELAPNTLATLPLDPFSGKPFLYRMSGDSYVLYSVGPNGIDDGGALVSSITDDGDQMFGEAPE
jgi:hypothetical protein